MERVDIRNPPRSAQDAHVRIGPLVNASAKIGLLAK